MNNKIEKIKKIIQSLIIENNYNYLNNKELYSIIEKYKDVEDDKFYSQEVVEEYNKLMKLHNDKLKEIEDYNTKNHYNNVFFNKGIYTINDLYKYMNDNFEYGGVLIVDNERKKLPFGPVNGVAKNNIITTYKDESVFNFILEFYSNLNNDDNTVNYVRDHYYKNNVDICSLKEYQQIIYKVSEYVQKNRWKQRQVSEILKDQISNCYESSFLVGEFLKFNNISYQKYIIGRYDNLSLAHMFITYTIEGKYYYFEHALRDFKGIYEYSSKEEMEQDIFVKFIYNDNYQMNQDINFDNYFLKPINDFNPNEGFASYFEYFDTIKSIRLKKKNYEILMKITDLIFKEILNPGAIYINNTNMFYEPIKLPSQLDFYDIELWKKKTFHILRKNIINIGFFKPEDLSTIYALNSLGGFMKYDNIIEIEGAKTRSQALYNKKIVSNIYTIADLKNNISKNDIIKIKDILMLTLLLINRNDLYEYGCYFATNISKVALTLVDNNINNDKICAYLDIDLCGQLINNDFCLSNDNFLKQIIAISSSIEVVNDAIKLVVKKDYRHDLINSFTDYLVYMLDINSIDIEKIKNEDQNNINSFNDELVVRLLNKLFDQHE